MIQKIQSLFKKKKQPPRPEDRRRYVRSNIIFPVDIKFIDKDTGQAASDPIQCFTRDISQGGMCLVLSSPDDVSKQYLKSQKFKLSLNISPSFSKRPIVAFANIMWHSLEVEHGSEKALIGIAYDNIIEEDRKKLFAYVRSLKRQPYQIALALILLIFFASWMYINSQEVNQSSKQLSKNLGFLHKQQKTVHNTLQDLKSEKLELKQELASKRIEQEELQNNIDSLSKGINDREQELLIANLQNDKHTLSNRVASLSEEVALLRQRLLEQNRKENRLYVAGFTGSVSLASDELMEVVKLNNGNVLVGKTTSQRDNHIEFLTEDGKKVMLFDTEIKSITALSVRQEDPSKAQSQQDSKVLSVQDLRLDFLKKIGYDSFQYFLGNVNKSNGLVADTSEPGSACSISAVGYALAAYCIAVERGWMKQEDAYQLSLKTLQTFQNTVDRDNGFYYHFVDMDTGKRVWNSELSSLDTSIFLCGALIAAEYFDTPELRALAQSLLGRVNWSWMQNNSNFLAIGWKPENGFLPYYWDHFNEGILSYVLAIGTPGKALAPETWEAWARPVDRYQDYKLVYAEKGSLSAYLSPFAFVPLHKASEATLNYWHNAKQAIMANRQFCIDHQEQYASYSKLSWGLSTCLGSNGYTAYGAKPGTVFHDGTLAPSALVASLPFTPKLSYPSLKHIYDTYGQKVYGHYGFKDAFNAQNIWFSDSYLGINQGMSLLLLDNHLHGLIWELFEQTEVFQNFLERTQEIRQTI